MDTFLIMIGGGDIFEESWERPCEVFSSKEAAQARIDELNNLAFSKNLNFGFRMVELEMDVKREHF